MISRTGLIYFSGVVRNFNLWVPNCFRPKTSVGAQGAPFNSSQKSVGAQAPTAPTLTTPLNSLQRLHLD